MPNTTVYIIDADTENANKLQSLLADRGHLARHFSSGTSFLEAWNSEIRGCVIMDIQLPDVHGLELQRHLRHLECYLPVLFLTAQGSIPLAVQAMQQGALDFMEKPLDPEALLARVEFCIRKDLHLADAACRYRKNSQCLQQLTQRERDVLEQVITGKLNKQIANDLNICQKTVEAHRRRIMEKMEVRTLAELLRKTLESRYPPFQDSQPYPDIPPAHHN